MIKDSLGLDYLLENLGLHCYLCNSNSHLIFNCPQIHFIPDKEKIIKQYNYPIN